jgi:Cyclin, N-terminal domain/Cyclin, C-terminal domain
MGEKLKQRVLTIHLAVVYLDILLQDEKIFEK